MTKNVYKLSPFGIAKHPWLNKPDTKFQADGVYKVDLVLSGPEAAKFMADIEAQSDAALEAYWDTEEGKRVPAKERAKWEPYYPFEVDTDEAGNPTGYISFGFKQNAKIKLKDGTTKDVLIGLKDAKNNPVLRPIFGGSELRVMYSTRPIPMKSLKKVGVRLDFAQVQVKTLSESTGMGFSEVDGYVEETGSPGKTAEHTGGVDKDSGGDY